MGCEVRAAYRFQFDSSLEKGSIPIRGTLEGAVACECPPETTRCCFVFSTQPVGNMTNPVTLGGNDITVFDAAGAATATSQIGNMGSAFTGLDVGFTTDVRLPRPSILVEATLVTFGGPAVLEAFDAGGGSVGLATMTVGPGVPETLRVAGSSIVRASISASQNQTLILTFCNVF